MDVIIQYLAVPVIAVFLVVRIIVGIVRQRRRTVQKPETRALGDTGILPTGQSEPSATADHGSLRATTAPICKQQSIHQARTFNDFWRKLFSSMVDNIVWFFYEDDQLSRRGLLMPVKYLFLAGIAGLSGWIFNKVSDDDLGSFLGESGYGYVVAALWMVLFPRGRRLANQVGSASESAAAAQLKYAFWLGIAGYVLTPIGGGNCVSIGGLFVIFGSWWALVSAWLNKQVYEHDATTFKCPFCKRILGLDEVPADGDSLFKCPNATCGRVLSRHSLLERPW